MISTGARRAGGYAIAFGESGAVECDTYTCSHCNNVRFVKPACPVNEAPDLCRMCMRMICAECADAMVKGGGCVPFERKCDDLEARDRFHRSLAGVYR